MVRPMLTDGFDLAMDAHAGTPCGAAPWGSSDGLEAQRDGGGDVKMRRVLDVAPARPTDSASTKACSGQHVEQRAAAGPGTASGS